MSAKTHPLRFVEAETKQLIAEARYAIRPVDWIEGLRAEKPKSVRIAVPIATSRKSEPVEKMLTCSHAANQPAQRCAVRRCCRRHHRLWRSSDGGRSAI